MIQRSVIVLGAVLSAACGSAGEGGQELDDYVGDTEWGETEGGTGDETLAAADGVAADGEGSDEELELGTARQAIGGACGSRTGALNSAFNYTTVPDHFPPDSHVASLIGLAIFPACAPFGIASMDGACQAHDECYGERGRSKQSCDEEARQGWRRACQNTYDDFSTADAVFGAIVFPLGVAELTEAGCRRSCEAQAEIMYTAVANFGDEAYEHAQQDALTPIIVNGTGPIFPGFEP